MRFLLDQDVYAITDRLLVELGHDVVRAAQVRLAQASDEELLRAAQEQRRLFVTRDRDFGALVVVKMVGAGVLYLRMLPSTQDAVHKELVRVLAECSEAELSKAFVVIECNGYRVRRIPLR